MSTSIYSGVSGLKAQQSKLDVIGNNIANINTSGYKSQRVNFSDILSQTIGAATAPSSSSNTGGTNPEQIGLGVKVGSIDTNMSTGSTQSTGNSMDVSIGGDGFFIVSGGTNSNFEFTRAGNFGVDSSGNMTVGGLKVCGWEGYTTNSDGTYTYNTQKTAEPLNLFSDATNGNKKVIAPKATSSATLAGNLSPTVLAKGTALTTIGTVPTKADSTTTMTVYDTEGNHYDVQVKLDKCYTNSSGQGNSTTTGSVNLAGLTYPYTVATAANNLTLKVDGGTAAEITIPAGSYATASDLVAAVNKAITNTPTLSGKVTANLTPSGNLSFVSATSGISSAVIVTDGTTTTGALAAYVGTATAAAGSAGSAGSGNTSWYWEAAPSSSSSNITVGTPSSGYIEFDSNGKLVTTDPTNFSTTPSITLNPASTVGAGPFSVKLDFSGVSTYSSSSTGSVTATTDGSAAGDLGDISVGSDGVITGSYSNGKKQPLGMLALAKFTNPAGLEKDGANLYTTTTNSGSFTGGVVAGSGGTGKLSSGTLEGSNVDLAEQFSDMMITQRAYQANSKIITTSDTMMETLINMIR